MFTRYLASLALAAALLVPVAVAQDNTPKLEGTVFLDEEACAKGMNKPDCVLSFSVSGEAAKLLFKGMTEKAKREECTGGMEKANSNGLHCIAYDDNTFQCDFGYHFKDKKFAGSNMDC
jgi:hypothetical protein